MAAASEPTTIGWREWAYLPEIGIGPIKVKVDTGAKSCALHAYDIELIDDYVHFKVHTIQGRDDFHVAASAPCLGERMVRDSGGKETLRPYISTPLRVNGVEQMVELTLIDRQDMSFRMLMGRAALSGVYLVDCSAEYLGGVPDMVRNWKPS